MNNIDIEKLISAIVEEIKGEKHPGKQELVQSGPCSVLPGKKESSCSPAGELTDLADDSIKNMIGVDNSCNEETGKEIRHSTNARVCAGRSGPRPRTLTLLRFLADHSLSRDTVFKEVPEEWVKQTNLFMVQTKIENKDQYLTRPDLGRKLSEEAVKTIKEKCKMNPQVQIVLSDGLSTDALTINFSEILDPLVNGLNSAGLNVGTPFFVKYGRVKVEDEIGELLNADVVVLLIGERPGLGQSESMSSYMIYKPTVAGTVESDRTVISNIHRQGTPPVEASAVIVDIVKNMLQKKASGINLSNKN
jgi:ethanolamine ammonia-lyase small subunit